MLTTHECPEDYIDRCDAAANAGAPKPPFCTADGAAIFPEEGVRWWMTELSRRKEQQAAGDEDGPAASEAEAEEECDGQDSDIIHPELPLEGSSSDEDEPVPATEPLEVSVSQHDAKVIFRSEQTQSLPGPWAAWYPGGSSGSSPLPHQLGSKHIDAPCPSLAEPCYCGGCGVRRGTPSLSPSFVASTARRRSHRSYGWLCMSIRYIAGSMNRPFANTAALHGPAPRGSVCTSCASTPSSQSGSSARSPGAERISRLAKI